MRSSCKRASHRRSTQRAKRHAVMFRAHAIRSFALLVLFSSAGCQTIQCGHSMRQVPPSLQLPCFLQAPLAVDKHAPPLAADGAAAEAGHDGLEPPGAGTLSLAIPRVLQDLVIKGAGLQEHSRDCTAESLGQCLSRGVILCRVGAMAYFLASWPPRAP